VQSVDSKRKNLPKARVFQLFLTLVIVASSVFADTVRVDLGDQLVATLDPREDIYVASVPARGEGLLGFSRRLTGTSKNAREIGEINGGTKILKEGVRYKVPFKMLSPDLRVRTVRALFREDQALGEGWQHKARVDSELGSGESLWAIALWFTGRGENYVSLRDNLRSDIDEIPGGETVLIPARLLRPTFRALLPETSPYYLTYGKDSHGEYASYRLKRGEALYSSVVVRFNGSVFAQDVNELAQEIASRSGIRDVTDIPVDYEIKVPFELLLPEFLPAGHPRRLEYEAGLIASGQYRNAIQAKSLEGVTVILDAGHGGRDVGASFGSVWESTYVYDIAVRVKRVLEETTAARVYITTKDPGLPGIPKRDVLDGSRGHRILTSPEYAIEDSTVGLNLRWYLSNSLYRKAISNGGDSQKVVFLSIHADSLHPTLRGAMAYIPGAKWRRSSYGKSGSVYESRKEFREAPNVSFSKKHLTRSEGLSRDLGHHLIDAFHRQGLAVHEDKPVRDKIIRRRRTWIPAVLHYNLVPASVLFEVCNLANQEDRALLQTADFREKVSQTLVAGLLDYYGAPSSGGPQTAAQEPAASSSAGR